MSQAEDRIPGLKEKVEDLDQISQEYGYFKTIQERNMHKCGAP